MQRIKLTKTVKARHDLRPSGTILIVPKDVDPGRAAQLIRNGWAVLWPPKDQLAGMGGRTASMNPEEVHHKGGGFRVTRPLGRIWVVIPTCNRPEHLEKTLQSIELQEEKPECVVVVDDGSRRYCAVARICKTSDLNVKLIHREKCSGGPNLPRIEGMAIVPDDALVVELDDHDLLCPKAFEYMRDALEDGFSFVYGDCVRFAQNMQLQPSWTPDWFTKEDHRQIGQGITWQIWDKRPYRPYQMRDDICEVAGARAYRKELYDHVGGWRENEFPAGDGALFLRFEAATSGAGVIKVDERLTWVRMSSDGISQQDNGKQLSNYRHFQDLAKRKQLLEPEGTVELRNIAPAPAGIKRIGMWLATSSCYSGGRLHMFQAAIIESAMDTEIFLITDAVPRWADDYYSTERIHIIIEGTDSIPKDIDVVMTDSKTPIGARAAVWAHEHNRPLVCLNFETPNWVEHFVPEHARALMTQHKEIFAVADTLIANSRESARYLREWLDTKQRVYVLPPKVNTYALELSKSKKMELPDRPYAVWSARSSAYKGGNVAMDAIWELDIPFDLVTFGHPNIKPGENSLHRLHRFGGRPDIEKYALMRGAHMVLAPSKFEGYGMVPMEALCSGTPCVVYDLPVFREEYGDDILEYTEWGDEDAFKAAVRRLAHLPKQHTDVSAAKAKFGLDSMTTEIERIPHLASHRPSVTAHMISYWGFVPQSLESVYPYVDEIKIAFGPVKHAPKLDDGSLKRIQDFPDPDGKITLEVRDSWPDKVSMRRWATSRSGGNYQLLLDGDEIWTGLRAWVNAGIKFGCPRWVNLWHGGDHWVHDRHGVGAHWGLPIRDGKRIGSVCPHYRWSWWRNSFQWLKHCNPADFNGGLLHTLTPNAARLVPGCVIYHLGHALPTDVMDAKFDFYTRRDNADPRRKNAWLDWNHKTGDCGDGIVATVPGTLPPIVQEALMGVAR